MTAKTFSSSFTPPGADTARAWSLNTKNLERRWVCRPWVLYWSLKHWPEQHCFINMTFFRSFPTVQILSLQRWMPPLMMSPLHMKLEGMSSINLSFPPKCMLMLMLMNSPLSSLSDSPPSISPQLVRSRIQRNMRFVYLTLVNTKLAYFHQEINRIDLVWLLGRSWSQRLHFLPEERGYKHRGGSRRREAKEEEEVRVINNHSPTTKEGILAGDIN